MTDVSHVPMVALLEATRELADICVCGHRRQQHTQRGEACTCWPFATTGEGCACTQFQPLTEFVTVSSTPRPAAAGELSPEIGRLVDALLASPTVRSEISQVGADVTEFFAETLVALLPVLVANGYDATRGDTEIVIALIAGWILGFGIHHQDPSARQACLEERLAIARRAAEPSAAVAAAFERRYLH